MGDGARVAGRVRRHGDQQPVGLGSVLPRLPRRARRLEAAVLAPQPRPALPPLADRVALVLQPRQRLRGGAALLSAARLGDAARDVDRRPQPRHAGRAALAGLGAARRHDLPRRLPGRAQRRALERDRRRLLGRDRRRADRPRTGAVGELPGRETAPNGKSLKACGTADASGEIRDWIQTNGRCESANPEGDTYGPVAYESYIPGLRDPRVEREVGRPARGALHLDRVRPAHDARPLPRRPALRRPAARGGARVRLGGVSRSRSTSRTRTRTTRSCRASSSGGSGSSRDPRPAGVLAALSGWTKFASLLVVPLWLTYPGRKPSWRFALGFAAATLAAFSDPAARAAPVPRGARLLDPDGRLPDRTRGAVVALGLAPVPRARAARPPHRPARPAGDAHRRRGRCWPSSRAASRRCSSPRSPRCSSPASSWS